MQSISLDRLQGAIIKPGFEKHLEPLLYYRGAYTLGRAHRMYNFVVSAMMQECESVADMTQRLAHNPAHSHLLGPIARPQHSTVTAFYRRLLDNPAVANETPGLLEYVRDTSPRFVGRLERLPQITHDRRSRFIGSWRTYLPAPANARDLRAQEERRANREARRGARLAERAAFLAGRDAHWIAKRQEREAWVRKALKLRADARIAKAEQKRAERHPRGPRPLIAYPFMIHDGGRPEHDLLRLINAAVPKGIMGDLRADICQDLAVGILCGDFAKEDLALPAKEMMRRVAKMFPAKWGPMSLDAIVPGTNDLRLIDTI